MAASRAPEAMPIEPVSETGESEARSSNGSRSTCRIRSATASASPSTSTTNSSPPSLPTVSVSRSTPEIRLATARSISSPDSCPSVSLTSLKPSRSMNIAAGSKRSRRARESSCSARSMISARFGSPVSASWSAWWRSWPVFSSTIRSARSRPRASTCTSSETSSPITTQATNATPATPSGEASPRGAARDTETTQRPSASTVKLRRSFGPGGTRPYDAVEELSSEFSSVRKPAPSPAGTRVSRTAACSRASETVTPSWPATAVRRIGPASNRPMIQPLMRSRRRSIVTGTTPPS